MLENSHFSFRSCFYLTSGITIFTVNPHPHIRILFIPKALAKRSKVDTQDTGYMLDVAKHFLILRVYGCTKKAAMTEINVYSNFLIYKFLVVSLCGMTISILGAPKSIATCVCVRVRFRVPSDWPRSLQQQRNWRRTHRTPFTFRRVYSLIYYRCMFETCMNHVPI